MLSQIIIIVFLQSDIPINGLRERDNNHPYIIAVGDDKKNISRYFIDIESHLFDVCSSLILNMNEY